MIVGQRQSTCKKGLSKLGVFSLEGLGLRSQIETFKIDMSLSGTHPETLLQEDLESRNWKNGVQ